MNTSTTPTTNARFADCMATSDRASAAAERTLAIARAALERGDLMTAEAALNRAQSANNAAKAWTKMAREALR